ncbi:Transposon Ty3-I Gag-Pol polyprotein [Podosphaera aphanis]|nr:Transposon Ty3-I Gag-Pol polyprotein [Podosphaera aphanis]
MPFFVTKLGTYPMVLGIPWLQLHDPTLRFKKNTITFDSSYCRHQCNIHSEPTPIHGISPRHLSLISANALHRIARRDKLQIYAAMIQEINKIENNDENEILNSWKSQIPAEYADYYDMMDENQANNLPPRRPYDHKIPLKEGLEPPYKPLYGMSREELIALKDYIEENLGKGYIRASSSPAGAPVLFVKKKDGSLRLCVDYRGLNEITIKNRYPLPLIRETLDRLSNAKWYTKLDLRQGYNQIRMAKGEEWKTAFRTRYGHFEYNVMPFGLTNAPATFQHFVNDCLRDYLDIFCTAFADDILIYSNTLEEHKGHVVKVLKALKKNNVFLKPEKCEFHTQSTTYLGLIIEPNGIRMDPKKLEAVSEWTKPGNVKDVQAFLGFANFYRRFIFGFSKLAAPLTKLTRKDSPFLWTQEAQSAFDALKMAFTTAPILAHFNPEKIIVVETDASDYVSAGILSQYDDAQKLRPVAYFSKKHSPAECNNEIYDKELLAIIRAFEEWRPELEGTAHPICVISDHKNLEYFMTTKQLNQRQARWAEYLSRFNFVIKYRPGKPLRESELSALFDEAYEKDPFPRKIMKMKKDGKQHSKDISLAYCTELNGRLLYQDRIFVPDHDALKIYITKLHHDSPSAGHPGREKSFELISREYYWPSMRDYIARYVRNCHTCQRSKPNNHGKFGVLRPLPIAQQPWQEVSMDFVTGLPVSKGCDAILVVVDRLTKMRHLIACTITTTSEDLAELYLQHVWKLHGLPTHITSDRGTQFAAHFWKNLCKHLNIEARMSTAFHPETDGQTERFNALMEQYLRSYVSYQQDDWVKWLPMAEFAANNYVSTST